MGSSHATLLDRSLHVPRMGEGRQRVESKRGDAEARARGIRNERIANARRKTAEANAEASRNAYLAGADQTAPTQPYARGSSEMRVDRGRAHDGQADAEQLEAERAGALGAMEKADADAEGELTKVRDDASRNDAAVYGETLEAVRTGLHRLDSVPSDADGGMALQSIEGQESELNAAARG